MTVHHGEAGEEERPVREGVPGAVATAAIGLVVKAASRTWDDLCVNEITTR
ncbi:hypothetical protein [Streptomyces sp. NBC_00063]|uniref:hypothetical protein n=1 Tax=Streptomyces sp. NBC_00063 TaxID=2975638 RepID=UPI003D737469